jgi:hypothetical protein
VADGCTCAAAGVVGEAAEVGRAEGGAEAVASIAAEARSIFFIGIRTA